MSELTEAAAVGSEGKSEQEIILDKDGKIDSEAAIRHYKGLIAHAEAMIDSLSGIKNVMLKTLPRSAIESSQG
jgi:hypothetical protein